MYGLYSENAYSLKGANTTLFLFIKMISYNIANLQLGMHYRMSRIQIYLSFSVSKYWFHLFLF